MERDANIKVRDQIDEIIGTITQEVHDRVTSENGDNDTKKSQEQAIVIGVFMEALGFRFEDDPREESDTHYEAPRDATRHWLESIRLTAVELRSQRKFAEAESILTVASEMAYEFDEPLSQIIDGEASAMKRAREEGEHEPMPVTPGSRSGETISTSSEPLPQSGDQYDAMPESMKIFVQQELPNIDPEDIIRWEYDPSKDKGQLAIKYVTDRNQDGAPLDSITDSFDFEVGGTFTGKPSDQS